MIENKNASSPDNISLSILKAYRSNVMVKKNTIRYNIFEEKNKKDETNVAVSG